MDRRGFLQAAAVTGGAVAFPRWLRADSAGGAALETQRSTLVVDGLDPSSLTVGYLDKLKAGGVDCWHTSLDDLKSFADAWSFLDANKDRIAFAGSTAEIRAAKAAGKLSVIFGWQGAEVLGDPTRSGSTLRAYYQLGLRIVGIAYNIQNSFGSGNLDPTLGLSSAGRRLVEEIHDLNILLDVGGHTGERTTLDAIEVSKGRPVICSHTNIAKIADNPRCVSDKVIDAIARTGGVIGITAISEFIKRGRKDAQLQKTPQATLDEFLDQIDYVKHQIGAEHVGLGPDFVDGQPAATETGRNRLLFPREMTGDWPWTYAKGFENISELPNVTAGLLGRGWSSADVRRVLGENWLRVYEKAWGA